MYAWLIIGPECSCNNKSKKKVRFLPDFFLVHAPIGYTRHQKALKPQSGSIMDERRLRKIFHFTERDLSANSRGRLSEEQEKRLTAAAKAELKSARDSAIILFVIGCGGLALGLTLSSIAPVGVGRILLFSVLGILWPLAWIGRGVKIIRSAHAIQEPRLCSVSGSAHLVRHTDEDYVLQLDGMEFDLDGNPSGAIIEGDEYIIHYVEATQEILSVDYFKQEN